MGNADENELMLNSALSAFCDALQVLLRGQVERRAVLENFDLVMLCLDETIDDGYVRPLSTLVYSLTCSLLLASSSRLILLR